MIEELIDPEAAAKVLGIKTITVYKWVTERKIPFEGWGGTQIPAVSPRRLAEGQRASARGTPIMALSFLDAALEDGACEGL